MHRVASRLMPDSYEGPSDRLELYERLVAANPEVVRKGATMPYTSRNGHMFSFLDPTGAMALRLNAEDRTEFLAEYQSMIAEQHGHQMKEYVVVPADLSRTPKLSRPGSTVATIGSALFNPGQPPHGDAA